MPLDEGTEAAKTQPPAGRTALLAVLAIAAPATVALIAAGAFDLGGHFDTLAREIQAAQRRFHAELAAAIRAVKADESRALWHLLALGFLYGVFHAAGPGHGKFVISTYLATSGAPLARGLALTLASSLLQGLAAVAVVEVTVGALGLAFRDARQSAAWLETASYALVALLGAVVCAQAVRRLWRRRAARRAHAGHDHAHDAACGHDHGPRPADLAEPLTPARFAAIVLSVGLRPCAGAVLALLFALALELRLAGYGAVAGISLGTAATVTALAVLAVYGRRLALTLAVRADRGAGVLAPVLHVVAAAGGLVIALIGLSLLQAALRAQSHPLL